MALPDPAYDEAAVPPYRLPDPLCHDDGRAVTAASWEQRRSELVEHFSQWVYGRAPAQRPALHSDLLDEQSGLGGAVRRQVHRLTLADGPQVLVLVYLPAAATGPVPTAIGLNFGGVHSVDPDPTVPVDPAWVLPSAWFASEGGPGVAAARGVRAGRWPVGLICGRGFGLVTAACGAFAADCPDDWAAGAGVFAYARRQADPSAWGTVAAWAWGLRLLLDAVPAFDGCDPAACFSIGHSRLGKAALWAAATDTRFRFAVANGSGCSGAALARRRYGERLVHINHRFPHWFATAYHAFDEREHELPVDQHELLASLAPRPVHIASAVGDRWADPTGEWQACVAAEPVHRLLGLTGLAGAAPARPPVGRRLGGSLSHHLRPGPHDLTAADWWPALDFAEAALAVSSHG